MAVSLHPLLTLKEAAPPCRLRDPLCSLQMLSLMEAQAQLFQQGHQSLSQLEDYRRQLNEEVMQAKCFSPFLLLCNRDVSAGHLLSKGQQEEESFM